MSKKPAACKRRPAAAGVAKRPAAATAAGPKKLAKTETQEYSYGFDEEKWLPYRRRRGAKRSEPVELALEIIVPEGAKPTDAVLGRYKDNTTMPVAEVTVNQHANRSRARHRERQTMGQKGQKGQKGNKGSELVNAFNGTNTDGKRVKSWIRNNDRVGHTPQRLVSIMDENNKQIIQVDVVHFRKDGMSQLEAENAGLLWARPLAEGYCNGTMQREAVLQAKKDFMETLPGKPRRRLSTKSPEKTKGEGREPTETAAPAQTAAGTTSSEAGASGTSAELPVGAAVPTTPPAKDKGPTAPAAAQPKCRIDPPSESE